MRIVHLAIILCVALSVDAALAVPGISAAGPERFVAGIGERALRILDDRRDSPTLRKRELTALVDRAFDLPEIARFTLGPYWRTADPQGRREFSELLGPYIVEAYWSLLTQHRGDRFVVTRERPLGSDTALVMTQLRRPGGERPAELDWTVTRHDGRYQIIDLSSEGVSQALVERSEFDDLIARDGGRLAMLVGRMRAKTDDLVG